MLPESDALALPLPEKLRLAFTDHLRHDYVAFYCISVVLIYCLHVFVRFSPVIDKLLKPKDIEEKKWNSCRKDLWKLIWHCIFLSYAVWVLKVNDLLTYAYWPQGSGDHVWYVKDMMPSTAASLYILALASYSQDYIIWSVYGSPGDLLMMNVHHILTLSLLVTTGMPPNNWAGGCIVILVHEPCDILLSLSKQFYYRKKTKHNSFGLNCLFTAFTLAWMYTRIFTLGWILIECQQKSRWRELLQTKWAIWLLFFLWLLHWLWFFAIAKVCIGGWMRWDISDYRYKNKGTGSNDKKTE